MDFKSLVSNNNKPSSSAILKMIVRISLCVSFKSKIRLRRSGPISEMVVRSGIPFSPYTSQKVVGNDWNSNPCCSKFIASIRSLIVPFSSPGQHIAAKSPFTSAKNTGTPMLLKDSANTFKVTVFPVPVAPAIIP